MRRCDLSHRIFRRQWSHGQRNTVTGISHFLFLRNHIQIPKNSWNGTALSTFRHATRTRFSPSTDCLCKHSALAVTSLGFPRLSSSRWSLAWEWRQSRLWVSGSACPCSWTASCAYTSVSGNAYGSTENYKPARKVAVHEVSRWGQRGSCFHHLVGLAVSSQQPAIFKKAHGAACLIE